MFERELIDGLFVKRWSIVRTLMPQSIAEHTFLVCHYANDIAVCLGLPKELHLAVLQYAMHHDGKDEIFTGDLPGPNKRGLLDAIGPQAKEAWDAKLREWSDRTFERLNERMGGALSPDDVLTLLYVVKTADWLESATRMATEAQMGNRNAIRHIVPNLNGARETLHKLCEHFYQSRINAEEIPFITDKDSPEDVFFRLDEKLSRCVNEAQHGQSAGPWITKEDESRTYHDPCVD